MFSEAASPPTMENAVAAERGSENLEDGTSAARELAAGAAGRSRMHLTVVSPRRVEVQIPVSKIIAEGLEGSFCLLPRHVDTLAPLAMGLLEYWPVGGESNVLAVDGGILVKVAGHVRVATRRSFAGPTLEGARENLATMLSEQEEEETKTRTALAHLEASFVRRYLEGGGV